MGNWEEEKSMLLSKIEYLQDEVHRLKGQPQSIRDPIKCMPRTPCTPISQKNNVNSTPQKLYNRIKELKEEQKEMKDSANNTKLMLEREITAQRNRYEAVIKELKHTKSMLINEKKQQEKIIEKLKVRVSNLEQYEKKSVVLSSELSKEKFEKSKIQAELDDIKKKRADMTSFTNRLKQQIKELKDEKNEFLNIKKDSSTPEAYLAQISELKEKNAILLEYQINAEDMINNLKERINELAEHYKASDSVTIALEKEQEERKKMQIEWDDLLKTKELYVSMANDLKNKLNNLKNIVESRKQMEIKCWLEKEQLFKELLLLKEQHENTCRELRTLKESRKIENDLKNLLAEANIKKDTLKVKNRISPHEEIMSSPKSSDEEEEYKTARKCLDFDCQVEMPKKESEYFDCLDITLKENIIKVENTSNPDIDKLVGEYKLLINRKENYIFEKEEEIANLSEKLKQQEILISQITEQCNQNECNFREERLAFEKQIEQLKEDNNVLKNKCTALEAEKMRLQKEVSENVLHLKQFSSSNQKVDEERIKKLQDENIALKIDNKKEICKLQEEIILKEKEKLALMKEVNRYKGEHNSAQNSIIKLDAEHKALQKDTEIRISEKEKHIANLLEQLKQQEKKTAQMIEESNKNDHTSIKDRQRLQKKIDQLETECSLLRTEESALNELHQKEILKYQEKLKNVEMNISEFQKKLKAKEAECADYEKTLEALNSEYTLLKNEKESNDKKNKTEIFKLEEELLQSEKQITSLTAELEKKETDCVKCEKSLASLTKEYSSLKNQRKVFNEEKTNERLRSLKKKLTELTDNLNRKEVERSNFEKSLEILKLDLDNLRKKSEQEINAKKTEVVKLKEKIETQQVQLSKLSSDIEAKDTELRNKNFNYERTIKNLKEEIDKSIQEKERLRVDLEKRVHSIQKQVKAENETNNIVKEITSDANEINAEKTDEASSEKEGMQSQNELPSVTLLKEQVIRLEEQIGKNREKLAIIRQSESDLKLQLIKKEKILEDNKIDMRILKRELQDAVESVKFKDKEVERLQEMICHEKNNLQSIEKTLAELQDKYREKEEETNLLSEKINAKDKELHELQELINEKDKQCNELENEFNSLKDTACILEQQVIGFEKLLKSTLTEKDNLVNEKRSLEEELSMKSEQIKLINKEINEEKSLRAFTESKQNEMKNVTELLEAEVTSLQHEIAQKDDEIEMLKKKIMDDENRIANLEIYKEFVQAKEQEVNDFKHERTNLLTELYTAREENDRLKIELTDSNASLREIQNEMSQLRKTLMQLELFREEQDVISRTTQKQQAKLIDYVRAKLAEDTKKKKTFTNKLFKKQQKENLNPKELEYLLEIERQKTKGLQNELYKSRLENMALRNNRPLSDLCVTKKLVDISNCSINLPDSICNFQHSLELKLCTQSECKCLKCGSIIPYGQKMCQCIRCSVFLHTACSSSYTSNCCVPSSSNHSSTLPKTKSAHINLRKDGWLKMFCEKDKCWINVFGKVTENELQLFKDLSSGNPRPDLAISLESIISTSENTDDNDVLTHTPETEHLSLIITVKSKELNKGPLYLIASDMENKTDWLNTLNSKARLSIVDNVKITDNIDQISLEEGNYEGCSILEPTDLQINCLIQLSSKVCVMGTDKGLYSLKLSTPENEKYRNNLILLSNVKHVQKINLLPKLRLVLFVCGNRQRVLLKCDLRELLSNAEALECCEPAVQLQPAISVEDFENCHFVAAAADNLQIAVAFPTYIAILGWSGKSFKKITRIIEMQDIISMVFTTDHLLFANKHGFFTAALSPSNATAVEEISVECGNEKIDIDAGPVDIVKVSNTKYLACTKFFGFYLNNECKRLKSKPIKWYSVPIQIVYNDRFIMTCHESYVVLMYALNDSRNEWTYRPITFNNPTILGISKHITGGIYLGIKENAEEKFLQRYILFDSVGYLKSHKYSWTSLNSSHSHDSDGRITDELNISPISLSVTSSMLENCGLSSDEDVGSAKVKERKVHFKDSIIRRSFSLPSLSD